MSTSKLRYKCDICNEPRYTEQIFQCIACHNRGETVFVSYCCKDKHDNEEHKGSAKFSKVNIPEPTSLPFSGGVSER